MQGGSAAAFIIPILQTDAPEETEESEGLDPASLPDKFMNEWHGDIILGVLGGLVGLMLLMKVFKSLGSVSKYGVGLDRQTRKDIKTYEDQGKYAMAGDLLFAHDRFDEAAELFLKSNDYLRAAEAMDKSGATSRAVALYKRAQATELAANLLYRKRQYRAAAREYESAGLDQKAAECYLKGQDFGRAAELFVKLRRFQLAGDAFQRLNKRDDAAKAYSRHFIETLEMARGDVGRLNPKDRESAKKAAKIYAELGEPARAGEIMRKGGFLREAADLYKSAGMLTEAAQIYLDAGHPMYAAKLFDQAGDRENAFRYRAEALLQQGEYTQAAEDFARAGDYLRSAELFQDAGDHGRAAQMWEENGEFQTAAELYHLAGQPKKAANAFEKAGSYAAAVEIYRSLADFESEVRAAKAGGLHFDLGKRFLDAGKEQEALESLQRVEPIDPNFVDACVIQGDLLMRMGRFDVAFSKYKAAVEGQQPTKGNVHVFYKMALAAEKGGSLEDAQKLYDWVVAVDLYYKDAGQRAQRLKEALRVRRPTGQVPPAVANAAVQASAKIPNRRRHIAHVVAKHADPAVHRRFISTIRDHRGGGARWHGDRLPSARYRPRPGHRIQGSVH